MSDHANVTVQDNPDANRYDAIDESGVVAGFSEYEKKAGLIVFLHTKVDDAFEGRGIGSQLVRGSLEDVRSTGLQVRAVCPFVKKYVEEHPEFQDLLTPG